MAITDLSPESQLKRLEEEFTLLQDQYEAYLKVTKINYLILVGALVISIGLHIARWLW